MAIGPGRLILLCKGGTNINEKKLKVLVVEPMELPVVREIGANLEDMQRVVGGDIQAVYPFDDAAAIICNEEGKLLDLPMNRALKDEHGLPYDIIYGTFFVAGLGDEEFVSLTEQQLRKYSDLYSREIVFSIPKSPQLQKKNTKKENRKHER